MVHAGSSASPSSALLAQFCITGDLKNISPLKRGHINETFISVWATPSGQRRYVHQKINGSVFRDIPILMSNIENITSYLRKAGEKTLTIIPTKTGASYVSEGSDAWRTYEFVEGTISLDVAQSTQDAERVAAAFGRFNRLLLGLDPATIGSPIPKFQNSLWRFEQLEIAMSAGESPALIRRIGESLDEIAFAKSHLTFVEDIYAAQQSGDIKLRVTHADPKINNCLLDEKTKEVVCIVDLDTCMPGTILYDFGDLARNTAVLCAEDETNLSKVRLDSAMYAAVTRGFMSEFGPYLTPTERELLPQSTALLALTLGVRFLTDHIQGDTYFKIHHPGHNLQRARTQFQLARSILEQREQLKGIAENG